MHVHMSLCTYTLVTHAHTHAHTHTHTHTCTHLGSNVISSVLFAAAMKHIEGRRPTSERGHSASSAGHVTMRFTNLCVCVCVCMYVCMYVGRA